MAVEPNNQRPEDEPAELMQKLLAYSRQRATMNEVLRSLASHHGWLAPLALFERGNGGGAEPRRVDGILLLSTQAQITPGDLWVFTDREAAFRAQAAGALLGSYAGGMTGTELFGSIPPGTRVVRINPGSPLERTWTFREGGGIEAAKMWADAIALEESFARWQQAGRPEKTVFADYRAFLTLDHSSGPIITLPGHSGMSNPAAAFTAPDCLDAFLSKLTEEQRAELRQVTIEGGTLLEQATRLGIDGLALNVFGPGAAYPLAFNLLN